MKMNKNPEPRRTTPVVPQRSIVTSAPRRDPSAAIHHIATDSREAAANIMRDKISQIHQQQEISRQQAQQLQQAQNYSTANKNPSQNGLNDNQQANQTQSPAQPEQNPYQRTHSQTHAAPTQEQWKQYHSAWQEYYQKYYERYYVGQVHEANKTIQQQASEEINKRTADLQAALEKERERNSQVQDQGLTQADAMDELRNSLRGKVKNQASKVAKSRHFKPILAAVIVMMVIGFLQYNRAIFATVSAYISPGKSSPESIVVSSNAPVEVGPENKIIIPKTNVEAPVHYGVGNDHDSQMKAMETGTAHFAIPGANSVPGQIGNTVVAGHSSNDVFASGAYKFVFVQNEKLDAGDVIYMHYNGIRYTYTITKKEVVMPTQVDKLTYQTDKPVLTLISCVPLGTAEKRLLITAEQVSPSPSEAKPQSDNSDTASAEGASIPGTEPTVLERLFGA